ncbi:MAG: PEP-CTERM sorting domain-containing protein [Planctomycetota bacterium]
MFNARFLIASGLVMIGTSASATVIAQDDFSYADGTLSGNGSAADAGWDGAWFDAQLFFGGTVVSNGTLSNVNSNVRTQRVLSTTTGADNTTLYVGFDYDPGTNFHGVEFYNGGNVSNDRTSFIGSIDPNPGTFSYNVGNDGLTQSIGIAEPAGVNRYVIQFNFGAADADTAEVFINGASVASSTVASDLSFDRISLGTFSGGRLTTGGIDFFDNLIIATTFEEANIPEPSSLALLGLGGIAMLRRRRI